MSLDDHDLIVHAQRGDLRAFEQLVHRYDKRVLSLAMSYAKDPDDAKDIYQEVFLRVYRALPGFRFDSQFSTWLYRIVANTCKDELRRRRRVSLFGNVPPNLHPTVAPNEPAEIDADLRAALGRLSPKLRMVVLLRYFDDLSYDEIADAVGVTPGTVASRLSRAHKFLARELAHLTPTRARDGAIA